MSVFDDRQTWRSTFGVAREDAAPTKADPLVEARVVFAFARQHMLGQRMLLRDAERLLSSSDQFSEPDLAALSEVLLLTLRRRVHAAVQRAREAHRELYLLEISYLIEASADGYATPAAEEQGFVIID